MLARLSVRPTVRRCMGTGAVTLALLGSALPAAAATPPGPDLTRFYSQKVAWSACEGMDMPADMQCGQVTVPLDYAHPGADTLEVALARYRATGTSRGSVVLNFGGPGGPGISTLAAAGKDYLGLTDGYDVVTFDPRGVGRSSPVTCGAGTEPAPDPGGDDKPSASPDTDSPKALLEQLRRTAAECAKHSGPVLRHMGTVDAARDLDVIRQAVGDKKLNYLGFSYGTRLGAVYAARFPRNVGRMALDGVDTLTEPLSAQGLAGAEGQQTALDDFLEWCTKDLACPFGQDRRAAGEQVVQLVHSLDENPVPGTFGTAFTGQDLVGAIGQGLYSAQLWPLLQRALASLVENGDTSGVENFAGGGIAVPHSGALVADEDVPVDNLPAALMAVNCADDPDRPSAGQLTKDLARLRAAYEQASPVFGPYRLDQVLMCYGRPKGTDYIRDRVKNLDTAKMLLVGTRGDPATPYRWTQETAARLGPSAVVLDNKGEGHTGYSSSRCVHRKVDDFLLYGDLPPDNSSCLAEHDD